MTLRQLSPSRIYTEVSYAELEEEKQAAVEAHRNLLRLERDEIDQADLKHNCFSKVKPR